MANVTLPKRFASYITTLAFTAFNDNLYKMLVQLYLLQVVAEDRANEIISDAAIVFTLPFVIFGPWAGYFADRFSKAKVMRFVKVAEIVIMMIGVWAFYMQHIPLLLGVIFLMAAQSTFFSPSKYGYIPEVAEDEAVTAANSWLEMATFLSIILGTVAAGVLLSVHANDAFTASIYCIAVAILGTLTAMRIYDSKITDSTVKFPKNPISGVFADLRFLYRQKGLWLAGLATSYFWLIGIVMQNNILIYGKTMLGDAEGSSLKIALLQAFIAIGIASGSMLASRWSGKKVELGLVPLGGIVMALGAAGLYFSFGSYNLTATLLFFAGAGAGLFIVPLYAYLQFNADDNEKGRVMASAGIVSGLFMVLGALLFKLLAQYLGLSSPVIFLVMGGMTIGAVVYICTVIPEYFIRFCAWLLTHTFYNVEIRGEDNIPFHGPALLTPNHVSYVDSFLIGSTMQRFIRFIMLKAFYDVPMLKKILDVMEAIPIDPKAGRESVTKTLEHARQELIEGHVVCIYPEGKLTRDGKMSEFKTGFESIMEGLEVPIIPVYMDNVWGSIFSFEGGKAIFKWPDQLPRKVIISFGEPLPSSTTAAELEAAVHALKDGIGEPV